MKDYIKKESFYAISRYVFEVTKCGVSRRNIADQCGFSKMTVGKVFSRLAEKGLITQIRAPHSKGRHAQLVIPSDRIRYLIINASDRNWISYLTDFKGSMIPQRSSLLDPSMSYKDNFQMMVCDAISSFAVSDSIMFIALIRDFTPEEDISGIALPRSCSHLLNVERTELVKRHISRYYRRYNSLYVYISGKECLIMVFEKSRILASVTFETDVFRTEECKNEFLHRIEEILSAHSISPDTLIFESGAVASVFANDLYNKLKTSFTEKGYSLSRAKIYEDMGFSNEEALLNLRKQTTHTVTDMFYGENK